MKISPSVSLKEVAEILNCDLAGDPKLEITGINEIHCVVPGDITFVDVEKYYSKALNSPATTILINKKVDPPAGKGLLITNDPFNAFNTLLEHFSPTPDFTESHSPEKGKNCRIGNSVSFGKNVKLGDDVRIGHNVVIGSDVSIGNGTHIFPNASIHNNVQIGEHCRISSAAVIGGEAFYYKSRDESKTQMKTKGRVVLGDYVDIGSGTTVDAGVTDVTSIGDYTKIDNLCQIGHDSIIGKRCVIASQVGIAGVVKIGDDVVLWGQVGVSPKLEIGDKAVLFGKTGVMSSLKGGQSYGGIVADSSRNFLRKESALKKLADLLPELQRLIDKNE